MDIKRYGAYQPVLEDALYLVPKDAIVPRYTFWYKAFGPVGRGSGLGDEKSRAPTRLSNRREQLIKDDKFSSILKASEITRQEPQKFPKFTKSSGILIRYMKFQPIWTKIPRQVPARRRRLRTLGTIARI
jgi:hypothetical protein